MSELDPNLARLLRERNDLMPEEFLENFLPSLHQRIRTDARQPNLWEQLTEWMKDFFVPEGKPALPAYAAVAILLAAGLVFGPLAVGNGSKLAENDKPTKPLAPEMTTSKDFLSPVNFGVSLPPMDASKIASDLLGNHFFGGFSDEARPTGDAFIQRAHAPIEIMPFFEFGPEPDEEDAPKKPADQAPKL